MAYSLLQWSRDVLASLGNTNPSQQTQDWLASWATFETSGPPGAAFNPLNTTQPAPGSTLFNTLSPGFGVRNYTSYQQGVQVVASQIANGYYPEIAADLRSNNWQDLFTANPVINQELSTWGTGAKASAIAQNAEGSIPASITTPLYGGGTIVQPIDYFGNLQTDTSSSGSSQPNPFQLLVTRSFWERFGIAVFAIIVILVAVDAFFKGSPSQSIRKSSHHHLAKTALTAAL